MGIRKGYNTERCPACHTRLVVKHSRKNGKYYYCTCCGDIIAGRINESVTERRISEYETAFSGKFGMQQRDMEMC